MCDICRNIYTGDYYKDLFEIPISVSFGDATQPLGYFFGGLVEEGLEVAVILGEVEEVHHIPIKYCPICGQDLKSLSDLRKE
jgi:hypothetical protein